MELNSDFRFNNVFHHGTRSNSYSTMKQVSGSMRSYSAMKQVPGSMTICSAMKQVPGSIISPYAARVIIVLRCRPSTSRKA